MRPYAIINRFGLKNPVFQKTASYGHFGRDNYSEEIEVYYDPKNPGKKANGTEKFKKIVEYFAWEKLDYVDKIKKEFGI